ncbi:MAG: hypothetical protein ACYCW6_18295 [Candidatus Xenobia bacterium]
MKYLEEGADGKFFGREGEEFFTRLAWPPGYGEEERVAFSQLAREIVEWRVEEYLQRSAATAGGFVCNVGQSHGRPIIFLPDRKKVSMPEGWTRVVADGEACEANFVKIAVNVVRRPGTEANVLGDLLRKWFGADAGHPGRLDRVRFERGEQGWSMEPVRS